MSNSPHLLIIHIALTGTDENFLNAMECIHDIKRNVSAYIWLKLENRSTEILSKRFNNH